MVPKVGIGRARAFEGWLLEDELQLVPRKVRSSGERFCCWRKVLLRGYFFLISLIGCSNYTPFFLHPSRRQLGSIRRTIHCTSTRAQRCTWLLTGCSVLCPHNSAPAIKNRQLRIKTVMLPHFPSFTPIPQQVPQVIQPTPSPTLLPPRPKFHYPSKI